MRRTISGPPVAGASESPSGGRSPCRSRPGWSRAPCSGSCVSGNGRAVDDEAVDDRPDAVGHGRAVERLGEVLRETLDARLLPRLDVEERMAAEQGLANPLHRLGRRGNQRRRRRGAHRRDCNAPSAPGRLQWPAHGQSRALCGSSCRRSGTTGAAKNPNVTPGPDRRRPLGPGPLRQGPQARRPDARRPLGATLAGTDLSRATLRNAKFDGASGARRHLRALRARLPRLLRGLPRGRAVALGLAPELPARRSGPRRRRPLVHAARGRRPLRREPRRRDPARRQLPRRQDRPARTSTARTSRAPSSRGSRPSGDPSPTRTSPART